MVLKHKHYGLTILGILIFSFFTNFSIPVASGFTATGGTITTSGSYEIHTFTSNGTFVVTGSTGTAKVLVIAGGGSGGASNSATRPGGGGGSGGFYYNASFTISAGSYNVVVGSGGIGTYGGHAQGKNSTFSTIKMIGGGFGGSNTASTNGGNGGSGGGAAGNGARGNGTAGQGNNGGGSSGSQAKSSGGGGSSSAGSTGSGGNANGGNGTSNDISGSSVTYAGGGGGGFGGSSSNTSGNGGSGGAGSGGTNANGGNATANTGSGGGGGLGTNQKGGNGGSGIVIISFIPTHPPATPSLTHANTLNSTAIKLDWPSVTGATFYLVNMSSPVGGTFSQVSNVTTNTYTKNSLTAGTQYAFKVAAGNSSSTSTFSSLKSNYTTNIAPTALASSSITTTSARITWTNPSGNFSGFKIERESPIGGGWSTIVSNTLNSTNHRDYSGLNGNTQYNTRISTNYATGSNYSGTSSPSTAYAFYTLPFAPTSANVTEPLNMTLQVKWTAGADNGTGSYKIERATDGGSFSTYVANTGNSLTNYNDTSITVGHTYSYKIYAIKTGGTSSASNTATSAKVWQMFVMTAYHRDNVTATYGATLQTNSSKTNIQFPLVSGISNIPALTGNQNFSIRNDLVNFVVKKQYNTNATTTHALTLSTNDYLVDCSYTGTGNDIELWTNSTDGHQITTFTTPTCFSNNTVKWQTKFTANGRSSLSYNTAVDVKVLDQTWAANATIKGNNTKTTMVYSTPYLISPQYVVGTGFQTRVINWSMNLTLASGYKPINYTIGSISLGGSNHVTTPITFNSTVVNSTHTLVSVISPNTYNMGFNIYLANSHQNLTYTNLPTSNFGVNQFKTNIMFKNPTNDTITIKAKDLRSGNYASDILVPGVSSIPLIGQIQSFRSGAYGTSANFGGLDIITFIVIIISFIGMNRVDETIGVIFCVFVMGVAAFFGIMTFPDAMLSAIMVTILATIITTRKLPWS